MLERGILWRALVTLARVEDMRRDGERSGSDLSDPVAWRACREKSELV